MAGNLSGYVNFASILQPASGQATVTSDYIGLDKYDKVIFVVEAGSGLGATGLVTCSIQSAHAANSSGATAIGVYTTMGSTAATAGYCKGAAAVVIDNASSWDTAETLIINGITFTMGGSSLATTGTFSSSRIVHSSSDMGAGNSAAEHLAAYINHATYGCTGLYARVYGNPTLSASSNNVYISGMGEKTIEATASATDIQVVPVRWISILETNGAEVQANSSHKYVAIVLTCSSAVHVSASAIRSGLRYSSGNEGNVVDYDYGV